MKKKSILIYSLLLVLVSCGTTQNQSSSSYSASKEEGIYTKLTRAIEALNDSFTVEGTLETYVYDGSNSDQSIFNCLIEVASTSYYYQEKDYLTQEITEQENLFATPFGKAAYREYNPVTNTVDEYQLGVNYNDLMMNPVSKMIVSDLKAIRDQKNWFEIKNSNIASSFAAFLTGYQIGDGALSLTQFALHFDGDNFDQFRFLLEYEEEIDDSSYYCEQYLFTLDVFKIGETTPQEIKVLEYKEEHDALSNCFFEIASAKNYTMNFEINYSSKEIEKEQFQYLIDLENSCMYSTETRTGIRLDANDEYEYYSYIQAYKTVNNELNVYRFDPMTKEKIYETEYNAYQGITGENKRTFSFLTPQVGLVSPACYKHVEESTFTSYYMTKVYCLRSLLPYDEYRIYGGFEDSYKVVDGRLIITLFADSVSYQISETKYVTTSMAINVTFENIDSTIMDEFLLNI